MSYILSYLLTIPIIIIVVGVHEYVRALTSTALGDSTPQRTGRCTPNLLKHVDPLGLIFMLFYGFGWGKPVNTGFPAGANRVKHVILVNCTPILANIVLAVLFGFALRFSFNVHSNTLVQLMYQGASLSFSYALVNFLPVYPMGGSAILETCVNPRTALAFRQYEKVIQIVWIFLIILGSLGTIIHPITEVFISLFLA